MPFLLYSPFRTVMTYMPPNLGCARIKDEDYLVVFISVSEPHNEGPGLALVKLISMWKMNKK